MSASTTSDQMSFDEWIAKGIENKWCTPIHCATHYGNALTVEEENEWDEGGDPCLYVTRMCYDATEHDAVMQNNRFQ